MAQSVLVLAPVVGGGVGIWSTFLASRDIVCRKRETLQDDWRLAHERVRALTWRRSIIGALLAAAFAAIMYFSRGTAPTYGLLIGASLCICGSLGALQLTRQAVAKTPLSSPSVQFRQSMTLGLSGLAIAVSLSAAASGIFTVFVSDAGRWREPPVIDGLIGFLMSAMIVMGSLRFRSVFSRQTARTWSIGAVLATRRKTPETDLLDFVELVSSLLLVVPITAVMWHLVSLSS